MDFRRNASRGIFRKGNYIWSSKEPAGQYLTFLMGWAGLGIDSWAFMALEDQEKGIFNRDPIYWLYQGCV